MSSASDYGHLVTVSVGMQNYFAQQGLWVDGAPCGKLALLLDRRVTPLAPLEWLVRCLLGWRRTRRYS